MPGESVNENARPLVLRIQAAQNLSVWEILALQDAAAEIRALTVGEGK